MSAQVFFRSTVCFCGILLAQAVPSVAQQSGSLFFVTQPVTAEPDAQAEAEDAARLAREAEMARMVQEALRLATEAEAERVAAAEAARLAAEEAERAAREAEMARMVQEALRLATEAEAERVAAAEAARLAAEEAERAAREAEMARMVQEALRLATEAEAERVAAAEAEAARLAEEEAARQAAISACVETAGPPSAAVPVSEDAQRLVFDRLRDAFPACREAMALAPDAGGPLFHMATVAQARGQHREAVDLYEQSAEAGIGAAYTRLGDYYNFGIGPIRTDTDRAIRAYRQAVELGDPAGTATLAFMYRLGRGVTRDSEQMVTLFEAAAADGYHFAEFNLAQVYLTGEGIPGNTDADLGIPNPRAAVPLLASAARSGNLEAALTLANLYRAGAEGVPANPPSQFRWTEFAAEAGSPDAIAARAYLFERGIGTTADPQRAAEGYVAALETGEVSVDDIRAAGGPRPPAWESETAMAFQRILQERGLYDGPIDGLVGRGTLSGARALDD